MKTAKVSKKGWVVIPKKIREAYGIAPGDSVIFVEYGNVLTLIKASDDPVGDLRKILQRAGPSLLDELMEDRRREREKEEREMQEDQEWVARAATSERKPKVAAPAARP
ncbi:MAG: AbrB/MazE/SpoVT family DNA-binding domain-containing protein [Dehalococcoidia bacterium]